MKGNRELREQTLKTKTVKPFGYGKVRGTEGKNEENEQGRWKENSEEESQKWFKERRMWVKREGKSGKIDKRETGPKRNGK